MSSFPDICTTNKYTAPTSLCTFHQLITSMLLSQNIPVPHTCKHSVIGSVMWFRVLFCSQPVCDVNTPAATSMVCKTPDLTSQLFELGVTFPSRRRRQIGQGQSINREVCNFTFWPHFSLLTWFKWVLDLIPTSPFINHWTLCFVGMTNA